ncbi:MAG: AgmX/PglI C-terminal domain-containing protein [Planctomycetes bacterium]|nr:AgmX/PglI C-terminal domain-containing protein [Planctomycetota bacterium]
MAKPKVSQCIIKVIRSMRFPKPKGGRVIIAYPFVFRSVPG